MNLSRPKAFKGWKFVAAVWPVLEGMSDIGSNKS